MIPTIVRAVAGTVIVIAASSVRGSQQPVDKVDPFIGTASNRWFFFAPAAAPFGLVKLAPDTTGYGGYKGGGHPSGYRYRDETVIGFSHLHDFQLGGFLLMPTTGPLSTQPGSPDNLREGWRSNINKATEVARPGYYSVHLERYGTTVELTATTRVGLHRYTFPPDVRPRVMIDVGTLLGEAGTFQAGDLFHGALRSALVEQVSSRRFHASITLAPAYARGEFAVHAVIEFNQEISHSGAFRETKHFPERKLITGYGAGMYAEFDPQNGRVIEVQVALSFVSIEQAAANLRAEVGGRTFDDIRTAVREEWNALLGRVAISGDRVNHKEEIKFYTALWHVLLGRGIANDTDGKYRDERGEIRQIPREANGQLRFSRYNTDALWGSFWNLNQVWALLFPDQLVSFARYLLSVYEESGWLPDGMVGGQFAPGMPSNQTTLLLAAAYARDPEAFSSSRETLWKAVWKNQTEWRDRPRHAGKEVLAGYIQRGFVPCDDVGYGPTGHSLEYSFEDAVAADLARQLGYKAEAEFLHQRSQNWRRHWDRNTLHLRPLKFDGTFHEPFNPDSGFSFAEGTARQYRWFVPHDISTLIRLFGEERFIAELSSTLALSAQGNFGADGGNTSGYTLGYNHGNQPGLHTAWLFCYAGRPDLSRYFVGEIAERFYGSTPEHGYGRGQDEDQGQLGAWYVLACLGLFDVAGLTRRDAQMVRIPPRFTRVTLHPGSERWPTTILTRDLPLPLRMSYEALTQRRP